MSSSRDEDRQQALSHHSQQDQVLPASRPSPPGDADTEDNIGSSQTPIVEAVLIRYIGTRVADLQSAVQWGLLVRS